MASIKNSLKKIFRMAEYGLAHRLFLACANSDGDEALRLINELNRSNKTEIIGTITDSQGNTALLWACYNNLPNVALAILRVPGHGNPTVANLDGTTPLICACRNKMEDVALDILATPGHGNPATADIDTALLWACNNKMKNVALAILDTPGNGNPTYVGSGKKTALITACTKKLEQVALAILETPGNGNPDNVDFQGVTALTYAYQEGLTEVVLAIEKYIKRQEPLEQISYNIDKNAIGIDIYGGENISVERFTDGCVFILENRYYLLTYENLNVILRSATNLYPCSSHSSNPKEYENTKFINLKLITGLEGFIKYEHLQSIVQHLKTTSKYFLLEKVEGKTCKKGSQGFDIQIYDIKLIDLPNKLSSEKKNNNSSSEEKVSIRKKTRKLSQNPSKKSNSSSPETTEIVTRNPNERFVKVKFGEEIVSVAIPKEGGTFKDILIASGKITEEELNTKMIRIVYSGSMIRNYSRKSDKNDNMITTINLEELDNEVPIVDNVYQIIISELPTNGGNRTRRNKKHKNNKN